MEFKKQDILELQAIKRRGTISSKDCEVVVRMFQQFDERYVLCETCPEAMANEFRKIAQLVEKTIGCPLMDFLLDEGVYTHTTLTTLTGKEILYLVLTAKQKRIEIDPKQKQKLISAALKILNDGKQKK